MINRSTRRRGQRDCVLGHAGDSARVTAWSWEPRHCRATDEPLLPRRV